MPLYGKNSASLFELAIVRHAKRAGIGVALLLPVLGIASGPTPSQLQPNACEAWERAPVAAFSKQAPQQKGTVIPAAQAARALLCRLKHALEQNSLSNEDAYTAEHFTRLLGEHYTFQPQLPIGEDDTRRWNFYASWNTAGNPGEPGRQSPLLSRGALDGVAVGPGRHGYFSLSATSSARVADNTTFFIDDVFPVLGTPSDIRNGWPSVPPLHGRPYVPEPTTHVLGNRWITYRLDDARHGRFIALRTLGDGAVVELQLETREK